MDRKKLFHGFVFDDYDVIDHHVNAEAQVNFDFLIRHREWHFTGDHMAGLFKVVGQALLVHGFQETRAEGLVHVNGAVDDGFGYVFNVFHLFEPQRREGREGGCLLGCSDSEKRAESEQTKACGRVGEAVVEHILAVLAS